MLLAAALILRPKAERVAVAAFGSCGSRSSSASRRSCRSSPACPVFSSGHNTRLIALTMLCAALLAGWGWTT